MQRYDMKNEAKRILVGKNLVFLLSLLILSAVKFVLNIVGLPMEYGYNLQYWNFVKSNKEPKPEDLIDSYRSGNFNYSVYFVLLQIIIAIYTLLWSLLFIIPGIVKGYSYSAAIYIFLEDPSTPVLECIKKSQEIMNGHKMERFMFDLSFIGHFFLTIITFGLWLLYVIPYYNTTLAIYYRELLQVPVDNVIDAQV